MVSPSSDARTADFFFQGQNFGNGGRDGAKGIFSHLSPCLVLWLTWCQDPAELDQITTLPNGIRVATEALPGHFSGIGVYVDAGSRYEDEDLRGVSHIIDRLAFKVSKQRLAIAVPH